MFNPRGETMNEAKVLKQIFVTVKNQIGLFASITSVISENKINITGICAWQEKENACFAIITSDNSKTISALKKSGFTANEEEVVGVTLDDKIGAANKIAQKIQKAGIDLSCLYGTTCGCKGSSALLILKSKDVAKLAAIINA